MQPAIADAIHTTAGPTLGLHFLNRKEVAKRNAKNLNNFG